MAEICCGLVESETSVPIEPSSRTLKRRKLELMPFKFPVECSRKRHKLDLRSSKSSLLPSECNSRVESCEPKIKEENEGAKSNIEDLRLKNHAHEKSMNETVQVDCPKFGMTSFCGRRRDMEDAVSIHPDFTQRKNLHFYGVFDGHGCSHVIDRETKNFSISKLNYFDSFWS